MNIWEELKEMAVRDNTDVSTSLLGKVPYVKDADTGKYQSVIPHNIRMAAKTHGFVCIAADYTRNTYTFRLRELVNDPEFFDSDYWGAGC